MTDTCYKIQKASHQKSGGVMESMALVMMPMQ